MMKETINRKESIGELATAYPGSISVFLKYGLDFCCGGEKTFSDACSKLGLKEQEVLKEVYAENDKNQDCIKWNEMGTKTLIDQIVEQFHKKHRRDFPILTELSQNVESRHSEHPLCPKGLGNFLNLLFEELELHMQKEEQVLFPLLIDVNPMASMPISAMRAEHDQVSEHINKLRNICRDFKLPEDACTSWNALYNGLEQFLAELQNHIHVENNILFNRT